MKKTVKIISLVLALVVFALCFQGCTLKSQPKLLLGKWTDSGKLNGYEFKENGVVDITLVNFKVPILNTVFNDTVQGSYQTGKNDDGKNILTLNYTIFTKTLTKTYYYEVVDSALYLTDVEDEDAEQTVYFRETVTTTASTQS